MKAELQEAWREYCESGEKRDERETFIAGWEGCRRLVLGPLDDLAGTGDGMIGNKADDVFESGSCAPI